MAGAVSAIRKTSGWEATPLRVTTMLTENRPAISYGTIALTWPDETKSRGAMTLLSNVTVVLPKLVDTIPEDVTCRVCEGVGPTLVPKMVIISPGDNWPASRLAPLTTAPITGAGCAATVRLIVMVWLGRPGEDIVTVPVKGPGAKVASTVWFMAMLRLPGVFPLPRVTMMKPPLAVAVNGTFPPELVTLTVWAGGVLPDPAV